LARNVAIADDDRNMFHEYDGPIVLLGVSGPNKEIERLAQGILGRSLGGGKLVDTTTTERAEIVGNCKWPDVVTIDLASSTSGGVKLAKELYTEGLLSIYINVDPESSGMDEDTTKLKTDSEGALYDASDYELCIKNEGVDDEAEWEHIEWELSRLLARARLIPAVPGDKTRTDNSAHLLMGENTFFLSLSFPDITEAEPCMEGMCQDVDALEYRADLLTCRNNRFDLLYGMQLLRRYSRQYVTRNPALPFVGQVIEDAMPIVYTVRTQNQAGTFPDDEEGIAKMFDMLAWGLRGGVEVLDVESAWDPIKTSDLLDKAEKRYASQILGSHHVVDKPLSLEDAVALFQQCALGGRAHGAKVVLSIETDAHDRMAYEAGLIARELAAEDNNPVIPHISLILGDVGQFSRVINLPFTPVTHECLPVKAAPGQLSASEIMTTRMLTQVFQRRRYAILGHNIAYSVSPQMHGAAFAATKLPNNYLRMDVATVEEFVESELFKADDFGGTSVTIPHKQAIMPYMDNLSDSAKAIGSVNTVVVKEEFVEDQFERVLYGDNTDWKGIFKPLKRLLGSTVKQGDVALILGAGGTARAAAYVAQKLGLERVYYNRTPEKAHELAKAFGGNVLDSLDEGDQRFRVAISTLPAAAEFTLPEWIILQKPIVFDVNYKPYQTMLLEQAEASQCSVVRGSEMLWEQGVGQFELWTERSAPYRIMKSVVLKNCQDVVQNSAIDKV